MSGPFASVFGSARVAPGDPEYVRALEMGRRLALAGWGVMTGGYRGVMEAASRGAREAEGAAVGVTIATWDIAPNEWLTHERTTADLHERLAVLVGADALIAVGGGIGTLAEVALSWNLRQRDPTHPRPLILVGDGWRRVIETLAQELVIDEADCALVTVVAHPAEAVEALTAGS